MPTFQTTISSPAELWLAPNGLARFQLLQKLQQSGTGAFRDSFRPTVVTFRALERSLASELGPPVADDTERLFILAGLAGHVAEALSPDGGETPIDFSPSFLADLAASMKEGFDRLREAGVGWDLLAQLPPPRLAKALAEAGREYVAALKKLGLDDPAAKRRMVLGRLREGYPFHALRGVRRIVCHWSQRFSPFETDLLTALGAHIVVDARLNIPAWIRDEEIGHSSGFDVLRSIREMEKHTGSDTFFLSFSDPGEALAPPPLAYASEMLLAPRRQRRGDPPAPGDALAIIHAASAYQEVEEAARRMKGLIVHQKSRPHDLALAVPNLSVYGPLITDVGRRYGLPFLFRRGGSMAESGPAQAALGLIDLWFSDWEIGRVLGLITNPYFQMTDRQPAQLRRLALAAGVTDSRAGGGFEENLARLAGNPLADDLLALVRRLRGHGEALAQCDIWPRLMETFKGALNDLGWPGGLEPGMETAVADLAAAYGFKEALGSLGEAVNSPNAPAPNLANLAMWLRMGLEDQRLAYDANPEGRVWALTYYDLHGCVFDEIFCLGLNEHVFPQTGATTRWWPGEFLAATAKASFLGRPLWSDPGERYRQEELMLANALGQARRKVWLLCHDRADDRKMALPSPLLARLKDLWPQGAIGETTPDTPLAAQPEMAALTDWPGLRQRRDEWRALGQTAGPGSQAMAEWVARLETYEGSPVVRPDFMAQLGTCSLAFWWGTVLGLVKDGEPLEECPPTSEGTLFHKVLEKFMAGRVGREWPTGFDFEECRRELMDILRGELRNFRQPVGRQPLWLAKAKTLPPILTAWLEREFQREPVIPKVMEWSFGQGERCAAPPLELPLGDGSSVYFKGRIDRVDKKGDTLLVRDYKTGRDMKSYRLAWDKATGALADVPPEAYPLAIYALAAAKHFGQPAESFYDCVKLAADDKANSLPGPASTDPALDMASPAGGTFNLANRMREGWGAMAGGRYGLIPPDDCGHCIFTAICPLLDKKAAGEGED